MIDDTRRLLQDLVSPDLKALQVQVAALEKLVNERFNGMQTNIGSQLQAVEMKLSGQLSALEGKVDSNHASVLNSLNLDRRIERLEVALSSAATDETGEETRRTMSPLRYKTTASQAAAAPAAEPEALEAGAE